MQFPRLCGGVFFETILSHKKLSSGRGEKDPLSQNNVLMDLIHLTYPDFARPNENTLKSTTSSYRRCRRDVPDILPFRQPSYVVSFQGQMENSYLVLLYRMDRFLDKVIGIKNHYQLENVAKILLEVIEHDSIETLPIGEFGGSICISELKEIHIQSFMLGVWFYIIQNNIMNEVDKDIYDAWANQKNRSIVLQHNVVYTIQKVNEASMIEGANKGTDDYVEETILKGFSDPFSEENSIEVKQDSDEDNPDSSGFHVRLFIATTFASYLNKIKRRYSEVKTLLYGDTPRELESFFVCNDIHVAVPKIPTGGWKQEYIHDANAQDLYDISRYIIIQGTGGLGKTMMLKHFLLRAIKDYTFTYILPIFINLREFENTHDDFYTFIYSQIEPMIKSSKEELHQLMKVKHALLLLDGLDEMKSTFHLLFQKQLSAFIDSYPEVQIIMSSRPFSKFFEFDKFTVASLLPFTKEQSLALIDKLDYPIDEPKTKERFKQELDNNLYTTHKGFASNPLLLTIMLKTYKRFAKIPTTLYKFYENAYSVLSTEHDATKETYNRTLKTGLDADQFHSVVSLFSALSYTEEKFEFSKEDIKKYIQRMISKNVSIIGKETTYNNFIYDLCYSICLMYDEGETYHFLHRSFQEYFCASFFSRQTDSNLLEIAQTFFDSKKTDDKVFAMLYDMIPDKIELYVFLPTLEELFKKCEDGNGYWTFLEIMYKEIPYTRGEFQWSEDDVGAPTSFLFRFIAEKKGFYHYKLSNVNIPNPRDDFLIAPKYDDSILVDKVSLKDGHTLTFKNEERSDIRGIFYSIFIDKIVKNTDSYPELRDYLESDLCPYHTEYTSAYGYYHALKEKRDAKNLHTDIWTRLIL